MNGSAKIVYALLGLVFVALQFFAGYTIRSIDDRVTKIENAVELRAEKVVRLETQIAGLQGNLGEIKSDVKVLLNRQDELAEGTRSIQQRVTLKPPLDRRLDQIESSITAIARRLQSVE